jgi:hypothetical protein
VTGASSSHADDIALASSRAGYPAGLADLSAYLKEIELGSIRSEPPRVLSPVM